MVDKISSKINFVKMPLVVVLVTMDPIDYLYEVSLYFGRYPNDKDLDGNVLLN